MLTAGASTFMFCLDEELNKEEKNKQDGNKKKNRIENIGFEWT